MKSEGFLLGKQKTKSPFKRFGYEEGKGERLGRTGKATMLNTGRKSKTAPTAQASRTGKLRVSSVTVLAGGNSS